MSVSSSSDLVMLKTEKMVLPQDKVIVETLFGDQKKIEELGTDIDLKDVDVKFETMKFLKPFILHCVYLAGFGPLVNLLTFVPGINRTLLNNYSFGSGLNTFSTIQVI